MRKIITQHCTVEQQTLFDLSKPINERRANNTGFELITNQVRRAPERSIYWEKIAWLNVFLPTVEDGSLVVWLDADSLILGDHDFAQALPENALFGMVQNRGGLHGEKPILWYNAGVLVMRNTLIVRDFLSRVWNRSTMGTDESAINAELRAHDWEVTAGTYVTGMHPRWNRWINNQKLCPDAYVQSWHGIPLEKKLPEMVKFISENMMSRV